MAQEPNSPVWGLGNLIPAPGAKKKPKRVGRGPGSGHGKTATRGMKGQKSRSGAHLKPGFEGGQMPLQRRVPKRGFTPIHKIDFNLVNIRDLKAFENGSLVDVQSLVKSGIIHHLQGGVKLLGQGEIQYPLFIKVNKCSQGARQKIEAAGGTVEII